MRLPGLVFACANSPQLIVERTERSVGSAFFMAKFSYADRENLAQFHAISPRKYADLTLPPVLFIEKNRGINNESFRE